MSASKKLVLYINQFSPPSHAVLLTAKALGLNFIEKNIDLFKDEHQSPEFAKINPAKSVPALDDNGFRIWESRAILGYLAQRYGKDDSLYPKDPQRRALVDNMLYFDATTLYGNFASFYYPVVFDGQTLDDKKKQAFLDKLAILDRLLGRNKFAAGDNVTIADLSLIIVVSTFLAAGVNLTKFPNTKKWVEQIKKSVPAYNEVMKEGMKNYVEMFKDHQLK